MQRIDIFTSRGNAPSLVHYPHPHRNASDEQGGILNVLLLFMCISSFQLVSASFCWGAYAANSPIPIKQIPKNHID